MRTAGRALTLAISAVFVSATFVAVTTAAGGTVSAGKPVIGKPVATPAQPQAGKPFSVSFRVTRGGGPLTAGTMMLAPTIDGQAIAHTGSFKGGVARGKLVVPANAGGKLLKVKLTIKATGGSATKTASFHVRAATPPTLSIGDASAAEGNSGTTPLTFPVTLSAAASQAVTVHYTTSDGSATAPSDYAAASGTLTFAAGEKTKTIAVSVVGDLVMEPDESFTVTLSSPVNGVIDKATATGTISNDDTAAPVNAGTWQGATQEGNFVFLTVHSDRTVTGFRANNLSENCDPNSIYISGSVSWGTLSFPLANDGSFTAQGSWTGSDVQGDVEWTSETWTVTGHFTSATAVSGTIAMTDELNYKGSHCRCSTSVTWTATFQG